MTVPLPTRVPGGENVKTVTIDRILSWELYLTRSQLTRWFKDKKRLTARDIADLNIDNGKKLEILWHMLSRRKRRLCMCDYASRVLNRESRVDRRLWEALTTARDYARGRVGKERLTEASVDAWKVLLELQDKSFKGVFKARHAARVAAFVAEYDLKYVDQAAKHALQHAILFEEFTGVGTINREEAWQINKALQWVNE